MLDIQTGGDSCASGNSGERGGVKKQPHLSGVGVGFSGITQSSYCIRLHPLPHHVLKYSFPVIFFFISFQG